MFSIFEIMLFHVNKNAQVMQKVLSFDVFFIN